MLQKIRNIKICNIVIMLMTILCSKNSVSVLPQMLFRNNDRNNYKYMISTECACVCV